MDAERRRVKSAAAELGILYRIDELVDMTVTDAKAIVEAAGGEFITDDQPILAKYDLHRVTASVVTGRVTQVHLG